MEATHGGTPLPARHPRRMETPVLSLAREVAELAPMWDGLWESLEGRVWPLRAHSGDSNRSSWQQHPQRPKPETTQHLPAGDG